MNTQKFVFLVSTAVLLTACGTSPEERRDKAEAQYYEEKTNMMQQYQACVEEAKDDQQKLDACERFKPGE